ncbi:hypothetical protein MUP05_08375 [Candidatus Bathyarchaeota archaeon]|nr:hypothetical protein [Candidatus Bathyarchaeota archaeon]
MEWLTQRNIGYFTASLAKEKVAYDEIMSLKSKLRIEKAIHLPQINPTIFFMFK